MTTLLKNLTMNRRLDKHFALIESLLLDNPAVLAYQVTQRLVGPTVNWPIAGGRWRGRALY